jgi:outer membrane receptor protein involved in Fe transport
MRLLEGAAELNAAVFYTDYTDLQTSSFDGGTGYYVINAGEATIQGVELDGRWLVAEGLTINGSMGYLDFNFDEFEEGPCNASGSTAPSSATNCDLSGMENIYTPEFSASVGFDYSQYISQDLMWRVSGNASFTDNQYTSFNLDSNSETAAYTRYDMTIALADAEGDWSVAVIGKNLSDVRRATFTSDSPLTQGYQSYNQVTLAPRTIALQGIYNF